MTQPAPTIAPLVLDLSCAQGSAAPFDFARAKREANVVAVILRVEAFSRVDALFFAFAEKVLKEGLPLGAYAFQNTDDDPRDEVRATVDAIKKLGAPLRAGLWNDVETLNNHSPTQTLAWDDGFKQGTEDALGQPTGLYTGLNFWRTLGDAARADKYVERRLWIAQYGRETPEMLAPWPAWPNQYGPILHQRWGNTIWLNRATREQKWGPLAPGPQWVKIASAHPVPGCPGEVDGSQLAGDQLERLLVC
jgi:GH25 family lysozyme M1 (1,4-beta-N-acetylmuramidase)